MSLDLDPTEQQLAAALSRIADAHVPVASDPPVVSLDSRRRQWLTLAVAASLVALVAGIWAVASRGTDPSVATVPPAPSTTPTTTPAIEVEERALPSSVGILAPDAAQQLGLDPTAWLQGEPETFVVDATLPTYAIRRSPTPEVVTWQVLPTYWWGTSRLEGTTTTLTGGRTAIRSDDGSTVTLSVLLDGGVVNANVGLVGEDAVSGWLGSIQPATDLTALDPPAGFEMLGRTVAGASAIHVGGDTSADATVEASVGGLVVVTVELDRDVALGDMLAARHRGSAFEPVGDDPSIVFDPESRLLAWQAGPRTLVEVPGVTGDALATVVDGLDVAASGSADLVPGVRALTGPGQIPVSSLTRTVLAATPHGRFAYAELDDGTDTCWQISTFLGGRGGCGGSMSQRPICVAARGAEGPWDAMIMVFDQEQAEIVVDDAGRAIEPDVATGITNDGTPWVVGWATGIGGDQFTATITVDGTACPI